MLLQVSADDEQATMRATTSGTAEASNSTAAAMSLRARATPRAVSPTLPWFLTPGGVPPPGTVTQAEVTTITGK